MKNFTKMSAAALLLLLVVFVACNKDEVTPDAVIPDPTGVYTMVSAELVVPDPLVLLNVPTSAGIVPELSIPAGPATIDQITPIVAGALAAVPCANPLNYGTFQLELTSANKLIFHCVAEDVHLETGVWSVLPDNDGNYTILTLNLTLPDVPFPVVLSIEDLNLSANGLTGTAVNYPMKKDFSKDFAEIGNQQTITTKMVLTIVP